MRLLVKMASLSTNSSQKALIVLPTLSRVIHASVWLPPHYLMGFYGPPKIYWLLPKQNYLPLQQDRDVKVKVQKILIQTCCLRICLNSRSVTQ